MMILGIGLNRTIFPAAFNWFRKLPGDNCIEGNGYFVFLPLISMIVISVILGALLRLLAR